MFRDAIFSPQGTYRYVLIRRWGASGRIVVFVGLNPSTADKHTDDPTSGRVVNMAKAWGFDEARIVNLFAFRSPYPKAMMHVERPVGPDNDYWIKHVGGMADLVVACWGVHGTHMGRDQQVKQMFGGRLHYLKLTKEGHPSHPLYLPNSLTPQPWS